LRIGLVLIALLSLPNAAAFAQSGSAACLVRGEDLRPVMETHTTPPYPVESIHQNEEGTVLMELTIGADGIPSGVRTVTSSGFPRLDEAAGVWIQKQWRWQPFQGKCAQVVTRISVKWDLSAAGLYPSLTRTTPYPGASVTDFLLSH
jgi:TonB family protein